jgi:O-antigen ligase
MARSRFGLGLTIIALFGALALGIANRRVGSRRAASGKLILAACAVVLVFSVQFALFRILERFAVDPLEDARVSFARNTIEAAMAYMPFGSGLGTFVPVYAMFEKPQDALIDRYVNHAHNDVLELWLNTGIVGLVLAGMFLVWLALRSVEIWRKAPDQASELDWNLARAATMVVALLIAHSFFDYPLRTGAMMAVMAFACALLIEPPVAETEDGQALRTDAMETRHRRTKLEHAPPQEMTSLPPPSSFGSEASSLGSSEASSLPAEQRWGADAGWPQEWTKPSTPRSSRGKDKPSHVPATPKKRK